jgi:hypothetical protein
MRTEILKKILRLRRVVVQEIPLLNKKEEYIPKCLNRKAYLIKMEIIARLFKKLKEKDSNNIFTIDKIIILYRILLKHNFKV